MFNSEIFFQKLGHSFSNCIRRCGTCTRCFMNRFPVYRVRSSFGPMPFFLSRKLWFSFTLGGNSFRIHVKRFYKCCMCVQFFHFYLHILIALFPFCMVSWLPRSLISSIPSSYTSRSFPFLSIDFSGCIGVWIISFRTWGWSWFWSLTPGWLWCPAIDTSALSCP